MTEWTYTIYDDCNSINAVASGMTLDVALLLLKALCEKYYAEPNVEFTIERENFDTKRRTTKDIWGTDVMSEITEHKELIDRVAAIALINEIETGMSVCWSADECAGMRRMKCKVIDILEKMEEEKPRMMAEIKFSEAEMEKIKQSVLDEFREYFEDEMC